MMQTANPTFTIERCDQSRVEGVALLFNAYRQFYGQPDSLPACRDFLRDRLMNHESVVYVAVVDEKPVGFVQLYSTFSSIHLLPVWILNDLYVKAEYRRQGIAKALIRASMDWVRERKDWGLVLETAPDNVGAQKLYESLGFFQDNRFYRYALPLMASE